MTKRLWTGSIRWSLRISGRADLSPAAPNGGGRDPRNLRRWLSSVIRSVVLILLTVPGAVEWRSEWPTLELLTQYLGFKTERVLTTRLGEQQALTLPDGPHIVLNTATTIHTQESLQLKEIRLEAGEVLIDSTKDVSRPVLVAVGEVAAETKRGKFSIRRATDGAYTMRVFGGEVILFPYAYGDRAGTRGGAFVPVRLESGRSAVILPGRVVLSRFTPESAARLLAWTTGRLSFDGESLAEAVSEFNRYNRQQIAIADGSIAGLRVGGMYRATDPEGFAHHLEDIFKVRAVSIRSGGRGASVIVLSKQRSAAARKRKEKARAEGTKEGVKPPPDISAAIAA